MRVHLEGVHSEQVGKQNLALAASRRFYVQVPVRSPSWACRATVTLPCVLSVETSFITHSVRTFCFVEIKQQRTVKIHLGEFSGKAWRYSGTTKVQFWPSTNKQGHPLIFIFIITDDSYLFIPQVYFMEVRCRIKCDYLRSLTYSQLPSQGGDEEKVECPGNLACGRYNMTPPMLAGYKMLT